MFGFLICRKFLKGPKAETSGKKLEFVVVGAGLSGLLSAYLLLEIGHKVTNRTQITNKQKQVGPYITNRTGNKTETNRTPSNKQNN